MHYPPSSGSAAPALHPPLSPEAQAALLAELATIVGPAYVLMPQRDDLAAYEQDWRKRLRGRALAVLLPGSTQEVAAVLAACQRARCPVVPQGGNTGLVLGGVPDTSGGQIVLSLKRMNRILDLDPANLSMTVQAGCILQEVQTAASAAGLLFPLSLAAQGSCTLGGNLATNAGGTQVLRYGCTRDLCLGLEVVGADGQIYAGLSGLRKDNTGYDLRHLFIGSEGSLGVITAATLKLYPAPKARTTALLALPDVQSVLALLQLTQRELASSLTGFEAMGRFCLELVAQHFPDLQAPMLDDAQQYPWFVLLENSDEESLEHAVARFESLLERALEQGLAGNAVLAQNLHQSQQLWHLRESIPLAQSQEGLNVKHDISLPISAIPDFVNETNALLEADFAGVRFVNFGHWGDGNLHYNVQCPVGQDAALFLRQHESAINACIYAQVARYKGSISAEHGIGALKREALEQHKSPTALGWMRAIKAALDPLGILNPGKVL